MSEHWMHAGGAAWLDAVLYDGALPEANVLLDGHVSRSDAAISNAQRGGAREPSRASPGVRA